MSDAKKVTDTPVGTVDDKVGSIVIPAMVKHTLSVPIVGITPLITNRFPEKARQQMMEAMQQKKQRATGLPKERPDKDPEAEFEAAMHRFADGGYGFPAGGLKKAIVSATRIVPKLTMTTVRAALFVHGEYDGGSANDVSLIRLYGSEPVMRQDPVKIVGNKTDLRHRPMFEDWGADVSISYYPHIISRESVCNLLELAGESIGLGEWRPEKNGEFGMFRINEDKDILFSEQPLRQAWASVPNENLSSE